MFSIKKDQVTWRNWSESVVAQPKEFVKPKNLEQLKLFVRYCAEQEMTLRVVGAGHSFTPLVATNEALVSLDHLTGIVEVDAEQEQVTVWAGTRLRDLGPLLDEYGYAMENLGDTNSQSIAGAISTGTHGTGIQFKSISNQVVALTMVTAKGEVIDISREQNERYFEAARLSLGMLGIIVKVTLKVVKAYTLKEQSYRLTLDEGIQNLTTLKTQHRNFEFFWFPYTNSIQVKTLDQTKAQVPENQKDHSFKELAIENGLFWMLSEMSRYMPKTSRMVSKISALGIPSGEAFNRSYLQYVTPRLVKFNEMEYSVPKAAMGDVLRAIERLFARKKINVHFPLECRYVKGDSIWLSPSYEQDSAYIAVHMYKGMAFSDYFDEVEAIFLAYKGRPHWGKMHTLQYEQLQGMYPHLEAFLHVREELDPEGLFLNEYLRQLFLI